jgi:hypothetical protein
MRTTFEWVPVKVQKINPPTLHLTGNLNRFLLRLLKRFLRTAKNDPFTERSRVYRKTSAGDF